MVIGLQRTTGPDNGDAPFTADRACAVRVAPGEDAGAVVAGQPEGAVVCFRAGVHRLSSGLRPRADQQLVGEAGAVLRGSKVLSDWQRDGDRWYVDGQTQRLPVHGEGRCRSGFPLCHRAENVFADGAWLRQVDSVDQVTAETFFFDYDRDRIWIGTDPAGRTIEGVVATYAIRSDADRVTVRGLSVEQFGNHAQHGAVHIEGSDWVVEHNTVRLNHGMGVRTMGTQVHRATIRRNHVTHQGQMGIGGHGTDLLIEANEIAHNNQAGFRPGWEAGGTKWVKTVRLIVRGNHVHHNRGPGLWTDIDNIHTLYEHNLSEDNEREGIFHEISYDAVIRHNTVRRNGFTDTRWGYGAGILIAHSPNVTVHDNTVTNNARGIIGIQQDRGNGAHGPYELENLHVHNNTITMTTGWTGLLQDISDRSHFTNRNNRFQSNHYAIPTSDGKHFAWDNRFLTSSDWLATGNDGDGTFSLGLSPDHDSGDRVTDDERHTSEHDESRWRFSDVSPTHPHVDSIHRLIDHGITEGCTPDRYCPADPVTRAQMATFLARARQMDVSAASTMDFADVPLTLVHRPSILAIAAEQIARGCTVDRYCPSPAVTRAQMATFLANALGLEARSVAVFSDVPDHQVHAGTIAAVSEAGIALGCGDGLFSPSSPVSRGQMATFLARALDAGLADAEPGSS